MLTSHIVVIAVDTAKGPELLAPIHNMDFIVGSEIHLVHVVKEVDYGNGVSFNVTFMSDSERSRVEDAVVKKMVSMAADIIPYRHVGKIIFKCLFSEDPRDKFCHYLREVQADIALIASRPHHGLVEGSFANYVSKNATCSVLVLRNLSPSMRTFQRVVIGVKLDDQQKLVQLLNGHDFLKRADLTLMHLWGNREFALFPEIHITPYPTDEAKLVVEQAMEAKLNELKNELVEKGFKGHIGIRCLYIRHPKKQFSHLVREENFELAVMEAGPMSRVSGSFVYYQVSHNQVPVLVLRSAKESEFIRPADQPREINLY